MHVTTLKFEIKTLPKTFKKPFRTWRYPIEENLTLNDYVNKIGHY